MITLYTRLDDRIHRSCGRGQTVVVRRWPRTTPRNLLAAVRAWQRELQWNVEGYGDVGAGRSWLDVNGVAISERETRLIRTARDAADKLAALSRGRAEKG